MNYNLIIQWISYFFIYSFIGWIWEVCLVFSREKHFVNRGFMHGPILPIYGFGAIMILAVTTPFKESLPLVFISGMIGATLLEYVTGAAMESLFHVRYWDYSDNRFNLNGHICLMATLAWGVFSVIMVKWIHPPIEEWFHHFNWMFSQIMTLIVLIIATSDFSIAFYEAMDLREVIDQLAENNRTVRRISMRIDAYRAFLELDEEESLKDKAEMVVDELLSEIKEKFADNRQGATNRFAELVAKRDAINEHIENRKQRGYYRRAERILRRNPRATVVKQSERAEALREMIERIKKGNMK